MTSRKTDNGDLPSKLALRRYFLQRYHGDGSARVLDCCQGEGVIWSRLRREFAIESYLGLDLKPKPGRLSIDCARYLALGGWSHNVIDIDTYGSPWPVWNALLPQIVRPTTVFLTRGSHSREPLDRYEREAIGMRFSRPIPTAFWPKLQLLGVVVTYCLTRCCDHGLILLEAVEAPSTLHTRYYGVRLEPRESGGPGVASAAHPEHKRPD